MAKNADSVILYYKGATDASYQQVMMNAADKKNYNGKILKANMPQGKLLYYIEAVTKDDNTISWNCCSSNNRRCGRR